MSLRSLLALEIVTALAVIGAGALLWQESPRLVSSHERDAPIFPELAETQSQVDALEIETRDYRLKLRRSGEGWVASSQADYPIRAEAATTLIADIAALRKVEPKTSKPEWFPLIGVEDRGIEGARSRLVRLHSGDDVLAQLLVGKVSTSMGADLIGGTFVRVPGEVQSWLASGLVEIPPVQQAWFGELFDIQGPELRRISIREGDEVVFDAKRDSESAAYELVSYAPAYAEEGASIKVNLLQRLARVLVSTPLSSARPAADVTRPADARTVTFETASGLSLEARIAEVDGAPWVLFHAEAADGSDAEALAAEITKRTERWAFRLPNEYTLALMTNVKDLLTKEEAAPPANGMGQIITDPSIFLQGQSN